MLNYFDHSCISSLVSCQRWNARTHIPSWHQLKRCILCICAQAHVLCSGVPDSRLARRADSAAKRCSNRFGGLIAVNVGVLLALPA